MTNNLLYKVYRFYVDGFRSMTIGRVLWLVILIKLFVIFFVLKLFFFPDVLQQRAGKTRRRMWRDNSSRAETHTHQLPYLKNQYANDTPHDH